MKKIISLALAIAMGAFISGCHRNEAPVIYQFSAHPDIIRIFSTSDLVIEWSDDSPIELMLECEVSGSGRSATLDGSPNRYADSIPAKGRRAIVFSASWAGRYVISCRVTDELGLYDEAQVLVTVR